MTIELETPSPPRVPSSRISGALRSARNRLKWKIFQIRLAWEDPRSRAFDKRYSVETAREESLGDMGVAVDAVGRGNSVYRVTWAWLIKKAMDRLDVDPEQYTFIDYGSGKGKAMLMASDRPFKSIIGLEYASRLHEIAVENCGTYRNVDQRCRSLQPILTDVLNYQLPPGPVVCFMCNPFDEATLRAVFDSWRARYQRREGEIRILYLNMRNISEVTRVLRDQDWLAPLSRGRRFILLAPKGSTPA